jgi:hypothetical protein
MSDNPSFTCLGSTPKVEVIRIATWNVSWWSLARLELANSLKVQLLALQETKLSAYSLEHVVA